MGLFQYFQRYFDIILSLFPCYIYFNTIYCSFFNIISKYYWTLFFLEAYFNIVFILILFRLCFYF